MWNGEDFQRRREWSKVSRRAIADELLVSEKTIYLWETKKAPHHVFQRALESALKKLARSVADRARELANP